MRYLVRARVKSGREQELLRAIDAGTVGAGSVAFGEYLRNMTAARLCRGFTVNAVADAMGAHRSTNFRHDTGLFAPDAEHLRLRVAPCAFPSASSWARTSGNCRRG